MHLFVQQFNCYNDVLFYDIFIIYLSFLIFLTITEMHQRHFCK